MTNKVNNINSKIGLKVKLLRTKLKLSQEELAERAELSKNSIGAIERGTSSPTIETLYRIAKALKVSLPELVDTANLSYKKERKI